MKAFIKSKEAKNVPLGLHKKATYTPPPDAIAAADENWRFRETLDARLADSKASTSRI